VHCLGLRCRFDIAFVALVQCPVRMICFAVRRGPRFACFFSVATVAVCVRGKLFLRPHLASSGPLVQLVVHAFTLEAAAGWLQVSDTVAVADNGPPEHLTRFSDATWNAVSYVIRDEEEAEDSDMDELDNLHDSSQPRR
jgi:hypothetical protein